MIHNLSLLHDIQGLSWKTTEATTGTRVKLVTITAFSFSLRLQYGSMWHSYWHCVFFCCLFVFIFGCTGFSLCWTSLVAQMVKRLPTMQETRVRSLGREDPLEKEMAIHSSTLAWKIPWMEERGRLQPMGLQRVGHNWATSLFFLSFWWKYRVPPTPAQLSILINNADGFLCGHLSKYLLDTFL